ncbi:GntR family transcriptional regulator [Parapedobacter sp. ISTM3]|uniref:GntR family transcriptional regulator n=1 Tax=Parapedobacter luteus TaxID=623280 RepID=A0A1T5BU08_9SPHI|nr:MULTISPECIES: GntR family transcriptional regulator [Parapedobacter]MBK1439988.1 GntR family transcriptional regulator [Parapedobacter sp. ISTM3]SKB50634.1 GntR family transcriptional regulator [Parapedobacter luteus]
MKLSIDHSSPIPLHVQAEELLRSLISTAEYRDGKLLPNEIELSKKLAISRATLRQALNKLVYEGLLVRKKGVGTKVASAQSISSKSKNWLSFSQEMEARGIPIRNFELHISWVFPDQKVANFFEMKSERKVLKLVRLRGRPEGPFVYFESYFHPRIGLTGDEDFKRPLYEMLEKEHNTVAYVSKEEISAILADDFIAQKLETEKGSAILFRKRFVYDVAERPIEYNLGYYKADSFVYTVESRRE